METSKPSSFTRKQFIIAVVAGLLFSWLQRRLVPESQQSGLNRAMAPWAIAFLSLAGGYVLFKSRDSDLEYYRAKMPNTEESARALQRRRRKIGLVAGALIALGSVYLVVLLIRLQPFK